jgi:hypothetical protein
MFYLLILLLGCLEVGVHVVDERVKAEGVVFGHSSVGYEAGVSAHSLIKPKA